MPKKPPSQESTQPKLPKVSKIAAATVAAGGSVKACERQDNPKATITGEYYFVVKVVPVNAEQPMQTQFVGTIHRTSEMRAKGPAGLDVAIGSTTLASNRAFRFEVQDLNSALDSFADAKCAIESREGEGWLKNATDYIVLKATIS